MRKLLMILCVVIPTVALAQKETEAEKWAKEKAAKEAAYEQAIETAKQTLETGKPGLVIAADDTLASPGCELEPTTLDGKTPLLVISGYCILSVAQFEQVKTWFDANFK